jgi:hypothetical protein
MQIRIQLTFISFNFAQNGSLGSKESDCFLLEGRIIMIFILYF